LRHAFRREAEVLWKGESAADSILAIAGLLIFGIANLWDTNEKFGIEATQAARSMAERMGLFGVTARSPWTVAADLCRRSEKWARATSHIAWGAYHWETYVVNRLAKLTVD
jgi:hypothetical protein